MGGERWLLPKSKKEAGKIKAFLEPLDMVGIDLCDIWVGIGWDNTRLELSYSFGGPMAENSELASYMAREICKRYTIKRIGADSVGWYEESSWDITPEEDEHGPQAHYGKHANWVEWMKSYTGAYSIFSLIMPDHYKDDHKARHAEIDAAVTALCLELDAKLDAKNKGAE